MFHDSTGLKSPYRPGQISNDFKEEVHDMSLANLHNEYCMVKTTN